MNDYGKRLSQALKHAGKTQKDLAKAAHIKQSSVSHAIHEGFGSSHTAAFALACGVSATWLGTGEGEMLPSEETEVKEVEVVSDYDLVYSQIDELSEENANVLRTVLHALLASQQIRK